MGAYYSKIEDDKLVEVIYKGIKRSDKETEQLNNNAQKYKQFLEENGYYKIKINEEKLLKFFEENIEVLESFKNIASKSKTIEPFISRKNDLKALPMIIMICSMMGFYVINAPQLLQDKPPVQVRVQDMEILLPKMYLMKDKYQEIVDFVIEDNMLFTETNEKKKYELRQFKSVFLHILEKIHEKLNPQVVFSNILGIIIKIAVISSLFMVAERGGKFDQNISMSSTEKKKFYNIIFKIMAEEIINLVPDDKCNLLEPEMDFVTIDPLLCKYDTMSIHQKNYNKCNIENKKLKDNLKNKTSALNKANDDLKKTQNELKSTKSALSLWRIIAIAFILLFIIFLIMYIMKKCSVSDDGMDESPSE